MERKMIFMLKIILLIFTITLAVIGILYVLDVFSGEHIKRVVLKTLAIIGILTAVSLVTIVVSSKQTK